MSVNIIGDKTNFVSKNAIIRLKTDIKNNMMIESSKYMKEGYSFTITVTNNDTNITIVPLIPPLPKSQPVELESEPEPVAEISEKEKQQNELRKHFRKMLSDNRKERSGENKRKLMSLKRSIPTKIFDSYTNLITKYKLDNIPAPDEVINNVNKYKLQISTVISKLGKLSDDVRVDNDIRRYFTTLADFLGIEPIDIRQVTQQEPIREPINNSDTEDEDD